MMELEVAKTAGSRPYLVSMSKYCVQLVLDAPLRMRVARPTVEIARRDSFSLDSALDAVSWLDTEQLVIEL